MQYAPGRQPRAAIQSHILQAFSRKMAVQGRILGRRLLTCFAILWAPLKTILLRFGRIFCPNFSLRKVHNTPSIPNFPKLNLEQNLLPKSSKNSF
jgi:hypothetical protein